MNLVPGPFQEFTTEHKPCLLTLRHHPEYKLKMSRTKKAAVLKRKIAMAAKTPTLKKGPGEVKDHQVPKNSQDANTPQVPGVPVGSFVYFGSRMKAPYHKLSNFSECTITGNIWVKDGVNEYVVKEYTFPSSEHFWCAHFFERDCDIKRLAVGGDLSTLETGLGYFVNPNKLDAKIKHWSSRNNVGAVASRLNGNDDTCYYKKASRRCVRKASSLGMVMSIHPCGKYGPQGSEETLSNIWSNILMTKMSQNKEHCGVLLSTGDKHLVEFNQFNSSSIDRVHNAFSSGKVVDGKLYGRNFMGDCMMSVRDTLNTWLGSI